LSGVTNVKAASTKKEVVVEMQEHVPTEILQKALKAYPKYQLHEGRVMHAETEQDEARSWFAVYKPVLLIFALITVVTLIIEGQGSFSWMHWMNNFMGGFFLTFSFFKLLDLKGFAENYFSYDILAKRWFGYGYVYVFIELALGLGYVASFNPLVTNSITFVVMSISIIGVLQSVLNKRKIKCACLGAVFNLPMSTVTIIEDALMIAMSLTSLLTLLFLK
jgi:hypothetical protein